VGVVGVGRWGRNLVRNFASQGALGAICDKDPQALRSVAALYPEAAAYSDIDDCLEASGIDAFAIATPSTTHGRLALRVIENDKAVFVEKPLCMNYTEARMLVSELSRRPVTLMVGHLLLYHPAYVALREFVNHGGLGEVRYIYSHRLGFRTNRGDGDALWDFAPHDLSMILGLVDAEALQVVSSGGDSVESGVTDTNLSQITFASGLQAHLFVSWVHPFKDQRLVVSGTTGTAVFDDVLPGSKKLYHYPHVVEWGQAGMAVNREQARAIDYVTAEPLALECAHFLDCVARGNEPRSGLGDALKVLAIIDACERSLESGQPVAVNAVAA